MSKFRVIYCLLAVLAVPKSAMAELDVVTGEIVSQHHDITIKTQGFIVPLQQTTLSSQVTGQVDFISEKFEPGVRVNKGDVLFSVEKTNYVAQVAEARQSVIEARLKLEDEKVRADRAKKDWRLTQTSEPSELAGRDLHVEAAEASLEAAKSRLKKAQRDLEFTKLVAPYDGVVKSREVGLGDVLMPGSIAGQFVQSDMAVVELPLKVSELALVDNIDALQVRLFSGRAGEEEADRYTVGYPVSLSADLNKQEQQARLRVKIPLNYTGDYKLFVNQYVVAKIIVPSSDKLFAIPEQVFTQRNSILSVQSGVISEKFPEVLYQYQGKKYCIINEVESIEVITETPDLYWSGAEVNSLKISMF